MGHIFISYSHKDKDYVDKLAKTLEEEGFQIWIDDHIHFGSEWPKVVERNLDTSDGVIIVLSKNSYESVMVQNEVTRATDKKKPIFPLLLDGDNWLIVQMKQYVDVSDGSLPDEKFFNRLAQITLRKKGNFPPLPLIKRRTNPINPKIIYGLIGFLSLIILVLLGFPRIGEDNSHTTTFTVSISAAPIDPTHIIGPSSTHDLKNTTTFSIPATFTPTIFSRYTPTSSPTITITQTASQTENPPKTNESCIADIIFNTIAWVDGGILLSFDAPFDIIYINMDNYRNVEFEDDLRFFVSSTEYFNFKSGLYDINRPNRLFILTYLQEGVKIQISLNQQETWHCTKVITLPYFPPLPTPKPAPISVPGKG